MNTSIVRRVQLVLVVAALLAGTAVGVVVTAAPAVADTSPVLTRNAGTVTDDVLPTAQIDGVAWAQAIAGNTVYVGGKFATARPAGSAPGVNTVSRPNVMAFDVTTGVMTSWAPNVNNQVYAVAVSPDKSRVYIGGQFTTVNGISRTRIAAFDTATGTLITSFAPNLNYIVKTLAVTNTTVYAGGSFVTSGSAGRNRLAAFNASNGALLPWAPSADATVNAMVMTPDNSKVIVGGAFANIGSVPAYGLAAIDPVSGAVLPWAASASVQDAGANASILSLSADANAIYGSGYVYGAGGNLEGAFSANPATGAINWIEDCHGDTYGVFSTGAAVYTVSHSHYCGNVGGFPQTNPWSFQRALAWTPDATGTIGHDPLGYHDWFGSPSPSLMNWFPDLAIGTYTGVSQAAWSVTGNSQYVVLGGEFPKVNNVAQQGLVRFAVKPVAPSKDGPRLSSGTGYAPTALSLAAGTARVSFPSNWDRDDKTLTYKVIRNGATATPVYTTTADSTFWQRPNLGFVDSGLTPGSTVTYRVLVSDPAGNQVTSTTVSVTISSGGAGSTYSRDVATDGASQYWRLGESAGATAYDYSGFDDLAVNAGVGRGAAGAIGSDSDTASTFDGSSNGFAATTSPVPGPDVFTEEAWVKTSSTSGGKIVGFGNSSTGTSSSYDRHIYMDVDGRLWFGVYNNASYTVNTGTGYNDNQWHQVVGTLSSTGMVFYVDGKRVGRNTGTTAGQPYTGYWRVGGDSSWSGSNFLAGSIDDVAIYPTALSLAQVQQHFLDSGRTIAGAVPPADAYGAAVYATTPDIYYRMDDASGPNAVESTPSQATGTYAGGETFRVPSPVTGSGTAVTFDGQEGSTLASPRVSNPTVYSEELWFNTSTTNGGKLIGFGSNPNGRSGSYDRHVYMEGTGQLTFGTYTGQLNTTTSSASYNDGAWHYLVATQGSDGMKLYVDNQLVGTNPQTSQQAYDGYWRVGGDTAWNGSAYFAGTIDEVAIYSSVLTAAQVASHYHASPLGGPGNQAPTSAFTATPSDLTVAFDGTGSTDSDGSVASYAWAFGDGTTGTGATTSHAYGAAGTFSATLTVTDNAGATAATTRSVTVTAPNQPPVAAFTAVPSDLSVAFDGTGSTDPDGGVTAYAWAFGDGTTGTGVTTGHVYGAAGTYAVVLTVTDDRGATASTTKSVTVTAPNQPPVSTFTSSTANLTASFDGSGSSDPDGSVVSYAWTFGDTTTGTGATTGHAYAAAGTYPVSLTVTDNRGSTTTTSKPVTVTAPTATAIASDTFGRTVARGWGTADVGGAWSVSGPAAANWSVAGGAAKSVVPLGYRANAELTSVSAADTDATVDVSIDKASTGGGVMLFLATRHSATQDYRVRAKLLAGGAVQASISKVLGGTETQLALVTVPSLTYTPGMVLRMRLVAVGTSSVSVKGKVWNAATAEPAAFQVSATDTTSPLGAGDVWLSAYVSGTTTNAPVTFTAANLKVVAPTP